VPSNRRRPKASRGRPQPKDSQPGQPDPTAAQATPEVHPETTDDSPSDPFFVDSTPSDIVEAMLHRDRNYRRQKLHSKLEAIAGMLSEKGHEQFKELIAAVQTLRNLEDDPNSVDPLCKLLAAEDEIRTEAFRVLSQLRRPGNDKLTERIWPHILRGLEDSIPEVRQSMVWAVQGFVLPSHPLSADAFELALRALHDSAASVRCAAIRVLRDFGLERVLTAFDTVVSLTNDNDTDVRRSTCELLGSLEVDALRAVLPLVRVVAQDSDARVRKAGWQALCQIDPRARWVDLGRDDADLRSRFIQGLLEVGEPARAYRRSIQARWRREMLPQHSTRKRVPPELRGVWSLLSQEERELLGMTWLHRLADGLPKKRLLEFLGMDSVSKNSDRLFRTRLSQIRGKLNKAGRETPVECRDGKVFWGSPAGR
jgi:HEAT repeat protein